MRGGTVDQGLVAAPTRDLDREARPWRTNEGGGKRGAIEGTPSRGPGRETGREIGTGAPGTTETTIATGTTETGTGIETERETERGYVGFTQLARKCYGWLVCFCSGGEIRTEKETRTGMIGRDEKG